MCRECDIESAELLLAALPARMTFWREPTEFEVEYGDIYRLADDYDTAEQKAVAYLTPVVRKMVDQLVEEVMSLVRTGDMASISKVVTAYEGELGKAIKSAAEEAVKMGKQQVFDQYRKQTGLSFDEPLPPRARPKMSREYLIATADTQSRETAEQIAAVARWQALAQISRGVYDEALMRYVVVAEAEKRTIQTATQVARDGIAIGRFTAIEDTMAYVDRMVYTAIMDTRTCSVCMAMDGQEVTNIDAAPNPNCIGEQYGRTCRCAVIVQYKRDASNRTGTTVGVL